MLLSLGWSKTVGTCCMSLRDFLSPSAWIKWYRSCFGRQTTRGQGATETGILAHAKTCVRMPKKRLNFLYARKKHWITECWTAAQKKARAAYCTYEMRKLWFCKERLRLAGLCHEEAAPYRAVRRATPFPAAGKRPDDPSGGFQLNWNPKP